MDIEFHLGLRGSDTWSVDGNETQVMVKTLIGQIIAERMPHQIPEAYISFAKKLQPGDCVLTFNYDILVERALDAIGKSYRLFPYRYKSVSQDGSGTIDSTQKEVIILKLHGSIDWFDKGKYRRRVENYRKQNAIGLPFNPIFNPSSGVPLVPLLSRSRPWDDPLTDVFRVVDYKDIYQRQIMFLETPIIVPPSATKVLWFEKFKDFWWGMDGYGALNFRMFIIGFSLAPHDEYALQVVYSLVRNYQQTNWDEEVLGRRKTPLVLVDLRTTAADQAAFAKRYSFLDWTRARVHYGGFNRNIVQDLL